MIVVAAAGNGNQDLDGSLYNFYSNRGDSGAIIVGSGSASSSHRKISSSTFGSRVDVQAWGETVFTTGYGFLLVMEMMRIRPIDVLLVGQAAQVR